MSEELFSAQDLFKVIRRHLILIAFTVVACAAVSIVLARTLPKKFKTSALLNLKSSYFEIPGVGDGLTYAEVQAQKQALMRLALDDAFMDQMGMKHGLFKSKEATAARESEREGLRKRIDFITSSATTFRITAIGTTAPMALALASDTLDQIVEVLMRERHKTLTLHRDSLVKQLQAMGVTTSTGNVGGPAEAQIEYLNAEIPRAEKRLEALRAQYTADHPKAIEAQTRLRELKKQLERAQSSSPGPSAAPVPRGPVGGSLQIDKNVKDRRSDFAEELLKKINYLDIALELERDKKDRLYFEVLERPVLPEGSIFPNMLAFAIGGVLFGLVLAGSGVMFLELRRANVMTPVLVSRQLGVPLLGTLPVMIPKNVREREEPGRGRSRPG